MPRANRYIVPGHIYHLTHRCHDRVFLLKFAKDRNGYRRRILSALKKYEVSLLGYTITSNHVHMVAWSEELGEISRFMQEAAVGFAQEFNRRKNRSGGYWEGRFGSTMVEGGVYVEHCLVYVDLNMVRCGKVKHPGDWGWSGYGEVMGRKRRNRVLDIPKLLELMGGVQLDAFRKHYEGLVLERLAKDQAAREPYRTESLAVGSQAYVESVQGLIRNRMKTETAMEETGHWVIRETGRQEPYGSLFRR